MSEKGRALTSRVSDSSVVMLLMTIVIGSMGIILLGHFGYIDLSSIGQYIVWIVLGSGGFVIFIAPFTKTKYDDMLAIFLLLLGIGGFIGHYLINNGYVAEGTFIILSLGVIVFLTLIGFAKETYPKLRR